MKDNVKIYLLIQCLIGSIIILPMDESRISDDPSYSKPKDTTTTGSADEQKAKEQQEQQKGSGEKQHRIPPSKKRTQSSPVASPTTSPTTDSGLSFGLSDDSPDSPTTTKSSTSPKQKDQSPTKKTSKQSASTTSTKNLSGEFSTKESDKKPTSDITDIIKGHKAYNDREEKNKAAQEAHDTQDTKIHTKYDDAIKEAENNLKNAGPKDTVGKQSAKEYYQNKLNKLTSDRDKELQDNKDSLNDTKQKNKQEFLDKTAEKQPTPETYEQSLTTKVANAGPVEINEAVDQFSEDVFSGENALKSDQREALTNLILDLQEKLGDGQTASEILDNNQQNFMQQLDLTDEQKQDFETYYKNRPQTSSEQTLFELLVEFFKNLFAKTSKTTIPS